MPAPTIHWAVDAAGDWATTADWSPSRLPTPTDDVRINTANVRVITHSTGTDAVHTLTVRNDVFAVSGGSLTINSTSSFANLLFVSGGTLAFGHAATVARFDQEGGTVAGAGILTVTGAGGPTTFASTLLQTGAGTTVLQGAATYNGGSSARFGIDGGRTVENQGVFTLSGLVEIGLGFNPFGASSGGGTLKNDAGAVIDIQGSNRIAGVGDLPTRLTNAGTLEKTVGTGLSTIDVATRDTGLITVATGTLGFERKITGGGTLGVSAGATLQVTAPAAARLRMLFNGGTLVLGDPASFAATIHAFGAGDIIDLLGRTATSATLGAGNTLVIKNGSTTIATLQLAGHHANDTFHVASDGNGGTNITVTPGPARAAGFIGAMAGLGGNGHGPVAVWTESHSAHPPLLAIPRMAMA